MRKIYEVFRAIVFWSYERGTWQYDALCVAILMFIFLIPTTFFDERKPFPPKGTPMFVSADELKQLPPAQTVKALLENAGQHRSGRMVTLKHFEIVKDESSGVITGYRVWFD